MKIKKVNRYYCDYCKKANCSASAMAKHEKHCTNNPNRVCRVCQILEQSQPNISDIIEAIPNIKDFHKINYLDEYGVFGSHDGFGDALKVAMPEIRKIAGGCPACILSALRQSGVPGFLTSFNYKEEMKLIWDGMNERESLKDQGIY